MAESSVHQTMMLGFYDGIQEFNGELGQVLLMSLPIRIYTALIQVDFPKHQTTQENPHQTSFNPTAPTPSTSSLFLPTTRPTTHPYPVPCSSPSNASSPPHPDTTPPTHPVSANPHATHPDHSTHASKPHTRSPATISAFPAPTARKRRGRSSMLFSSPASPPLTSLPPRLWRGSHPTPHPHSPPPMLLIGGPAHSHFSALCPDAHSSSSPAPRRIDLLRRGRGGGRRGEGGEGVRRLGPRLLGRGG